MHEQDAVLPELHPEHDCELLHEHEDAMYTEHPVPPLTYPELQLVQLTEPLQEQDDVLPELHPEHDFVPLHEHDEDVYPPLQPEQLTEPYDP